MRSLLVLALVLTGGCSCDRSPSTTRERVPATETVAPAQLPPSPFPLEWMSADTWAHLTSIEARERSAAGLCEVPLSEPLESAECDREMTRSGSLRLCFDADERPLPLDALLDVRVAGRIGAIRDACRPVVDTLLRVPDPAGCALGGGQRVAYAAMIIAWDRAYGGDVDGAARLVVQVMTALAYWSRSEADDRTPAHHAIGEGVSLLEAWRARLSPETLDATRHELEAVAARIDPHAALRIDLLWRAEHARTVDPARPERSASWAAINYEIATTLLDSLDGSADAGLSRIAADVRERFRSAPRPPDRFEPRYHDGMLADREAAVIDQVARAMRESREVRARLETLLASW